MTIHFTCTGCQRAFRVEDRHAGARTKCPECGAVLTVPQPAAAEEVAREAPAAPEARSAAATPAAAFGPDEQGEPVISFGRSNEGAEQELDMTPMVDVTFLLLIFFMVTAAFSLQKSIEIPPTNEESASETRTLEEFEEDRDYIVVRVDSDNVYWISSPATDAEAEAPNEFDLLRLLREARRPGGGGPGPGKLLVLASGEARHEYVVRALDAGTAVGMEEVKLATAEEDE